MSHKYSMTDISNTFTKEIRAKKARWQKNRDILSGTDATRARAHNYLYRLDGARQPIYGVSAEKFKAMVPFHPVASITAQMFNGLVFRVNPTADIPDTHISVFDTVTRSGLSLNSLAKKAFDETLAVNYSAILVDHAAPQTGLNKANALAKGYRPFLTFYQAEQIQVVEVEVINNRVEYSKIVLKDDESTYRELTLINGVYTVTIYENINDRWVQSQPYTPTMNGKSLSEIPFVLITTDEDNHLPTAAPLDNLVDQNIDLYNAWADVKVGSHCAAQHMMVFTNVNKDDAKDIDLRAGNSIMLSPTGEGNAEPKVEWLAASGGYDHMAIVDKIRENCAESGAQYIGKAGVESAETLLIRRTSEFATLQSIADLVSSKINEALEYFCDWLSIEHVEIRLNKDFVAKGLSPEEIKAKLLLFQSGAISIYTLHDMLVDGEALPVNFDSELEVDRLNTQI